MNRPAPGYRTSGGPAGPTISCIRGNPVCHPVSNCPCWFSMLQIVGYPHLILFKINNFVFSSGSASKNARYFLSLVTVSTASRKLAIFVSAIGAISQGMMPVRMVDGRDVSKAPGHFPQKMSYRTKERASDEDEDAGLTVADPVLWTQVWVKRLAGSRLAPRRDGRGGGCAVHFSRSAIRYCSARRTGGRRPSRRRWSGRCGHGRPAP